MSLFLIVNRLQLDKTNENATTADDVGDDDAFFAQSALAEYEKSRCTTSQSDYLSPSFLPCSSAIVESFFSVAKHVFGARRVGTLPVAVEEQMFLRQNRALWGDTTVAKVRLDRQKVKKDDESREHQAGNQEVEKQKKKKKSSESDSASEIGPVLKKTKK